MADQDPPRLDPDQVAEIVSGYVRHHQVPASQLAGLIAEVHRALASLGRTPPAQEPSPKVSIRRSVRQDYIVCLECGFRARTLRRHPRAGHGLAVADYRTRWKLPLNYPISAPNSSARRATVAKKIALGRRRAAAEPRPPAAEPRGTRRGVRRPRPST